MPKLLFKLKQKNRIHIVMLLLCTTAFYAQDKIMISYGQKIDLGDVAAEARFNIKGTQDKIHLKGNEINTYRFSKPGIYHIEVDETVKHNEHKCNATHLPKEILVEVSRIKMVFDKNIELSSPILKNKNAKGITLRVPVTIETYDHLPAILNRTIVNTAGIGSNIAARLETAAVELPEGKHKLEYALDGVVTQNSYLMFDFIDANASIQSVALTSPIKD